ncbi:MAG: outer membrane beta-barrel protein [Sphingomonadaceae bacterium]
MLSAIQPAHAQGASGGGSALFRSDAAGVRIEPQYEPTPIRIGPLLADIRLAASAVADNNVLKTSDGSIDDVYLALVPSIRLIGNVGPDSISLAGRADFRRYVRREAENSETFDLTASSRISLSQDAQVNWRAQIAREVESRGSAGTNVRDASPAEYRTIDIQGSGRAEFGRLSVSAGAGVARQSYLPIRLETGARLDQSFRDTRTLSVAPRASFLLTPATSFFIGGSATKRESLDRRLGQLRDSNGIALLGGVRLEGERLIVGEIGVGWRRQNYRNPAFSDFGGLTYDATVDWYPTPLMSVRAQAGQDIVNSGIATVAGVVRQSFGLKGFYDPRRNIRIIAGFDHEHDDYREIALTTDTATATLTGQYLAGRHLIMSAFCRFQVKGSSDPQTIDDYRSLAIGVAFTGRL